MKKLPILIFCLLTLALAACGRESESQAPSSENNAATEITVIEAPADESVAEESVATDSDNSDAEGESEADNNSEAAGVSVGSLASGYLGSYEFEDTGFGTQVSAVVDSQARTRTITSNALPNHETGEFPNPGNPNTISAQDKSWTLTTEPTFVGTTTFVRETGVAINGVKFEPGTAERATCESGEAHRIEAIQDVTDLGLDFNNAHVQPTGEYHYHGVSELLVALYSSEQDLVHVGFAADGHLIYYSKSGGYQSSYRLGEGAREGTNCTYTAGGPNANGTAITFGPDKDGSLTSDWDFNADYGQLDECSGLTVDGQYIYLLTNDYPYIPRCLMGEVTQSGPGGGGQGGGGQGAGGQGAGGPGADGQGAGGPGADGQDAGGPGADGQGAGGPGAGGQGAGGQGAGGPGAGGQGGGRQGGGGPGAGGPPDFAAAATQLGISQQALMDALGGPPPNFEAAAATLGITLEALQDALGTPPQ